ncbi:MAG: hypothetical protein R3A48_13655 [Polyangiales bacterium]
MSSAQRGFTDPPYTGPLGATRREPAFVPAANGAHRRVDLVRAVNAVTDPALARQALDGSLHRGAEHDLAVPFVYHDPAQRRFYLVIPPARAHEELTLRAELLTRLAGETQEVLPGYVREARAVVGAAGLRGALDEPARGAPDPRAAEIARREQALSAREAAALARGEEHEAQAADLALREQELELRMNELLAREESLSEAQALVRANTAALNARENLLAQRERAGALEPSPPTEVLDDELELEPEETTGQHRVSRVLPDDELELEPEAEAEAEPVLEAELSADDVAPIEDQPVSQWVQSDRRPFAAVVDNEVRIYCEGTAETALRLNSTVAPTLQLDPAGHLPLALLTVAGDRGAVTRVVLDITRPEDHAVLEALGREFRVRVEVVNSTGHSLGGHPCGAPSEAIAQRALEVLNKRDPGVDSARAHEAARLIAEGVRWSEVDVAAVSFDEDSVLATADSVESALAAYEPLLSRLRADRFSLATGVAPSVIEASGRRLVFAALRCGVLLSPAFIQFGIHHGVATDEKALASRALTTYARSLEGGPESIGRDGIGASQAWSPLLAWAERLDVPVPEAARDAVAAVYDPDAPDATPALDPREPPDASAYATMDLKTLSAWLTHPVAVTAAAGELVRRDPTKHVVELRKAMRLLPAKELAALGPTLLTFGDALADFWVELLASRRHRVVTVACAAVGALKLRRALTPLVQRTMLPESDAWRLSGWAAGELGAAATRAVTRLDHPDPERVAWLLAHAVRNGAAREIERARAGANSAFSDAATRALTLQDEARRYDESLRAGTAEGEAERLVAAIFTRGNSE